MNLTGRFGRLVLGAALVLPIAACNVDVEKDKDGDKATVDIRTPVGGVSVRTNEGNNTGLPVYPGARPLLDDGETKNANVDIGTRWFGLKVAAAKFETSDAPDGVAAFYRRELKSFGEVSECNGDLDWRRHRLVCKERSRRHEIQLGVGTEENHRIVAIKERGTGSELAIVNIQTRKD